MSIGIDIKEPLRSSVLAPTPAELILTLSPLWTTQPHRKVGKLEKRERPKT